MEFAVSAYVTSPASLEEQASYYQHLRAADYSVIELPLLPTGLLHPDEPFLFSQLSSHPTPLRVIITCVPATMTALTSTPPVLLGLAADDEPSRERALALTRQAQQALSRINHALGRPAVCGVAVHSGPGSSRGPTSASALQRSLVELAQWGWEGAALLVEHCDAAGPHPPSKGFLSLEQELSALTGAVTALAAQPAAAPLGLVLNWARSVLESRDAATPLAHIALASPHLRGFSFSGCSGQEGLYGAWQDTHMAHQPFAPGSLLTVQAIEECTRALRGAPHLAWVGSKTALRDSDPLALTPQRRAEVHQHLLGIVRRVLAE